MSKLGAHHHPEVAMWPSYVQGHAHQSTETEEEQIFSHIEAVLKTAPQSLFSATIKGLCHI